VTTSHDYRVICLDFCVFKTSNGIYDRFSVVQPYVQPSLACIQERARLILVRFSFVDSPRNGRWRFLRPQVGISWWSMSSLHPNHIPIPRTLDCDSSRKSRATHDPVVFRNDRFSLVWILCLDSSICTFRKVEYGSSHERLPLWSTLRSETNPI
jgi:hypothetical protein